MNKNLQPGNQNNFRLRNARNKSVYHSNADTSDKARESALLMLAQLSLSKMVAQIKKH